MKNEIIEFDDLTFAAYIKISKIMRTPENGENPTDEPKHGGDRSDEFIFELYREIVFELSDLPEDYYYNDTFIELSIDGIVEQYEKITKLMIEPPDFGLLSDDEFVLNETVLKFQPFKDWSFNKWVTFENAMKGQYAEDEESGELVEVAGGELFVLPVCFGEWFDDMPNFEAKFDLFNNRLKAIDVMPAFSRVNGLVNALKENHSEIYSESGDESEGSNAFKKHVENFGWLETLRSLSEKGVFGNYLETKKANALQVLEYLNCAISKESARHEDFLNQSKNK